MKKVLICDYTNALEPNYEPTISSMSEALGEPVECLIRPYVSDEELVQELAGADGLITGFLEIGAEDSGTGTGAGMHLCQRCGIFQHRRCGGKTASCCSLSYPGILHGGGCRAHVCTDRRLKPPH